MARIPYMEYEQAPEQTKVMYDQLQSMNGLVNVYKIIGNHPKALQGLMGMSMATYRSGDLDPQLAELVYLYTSTLNQCHY
ncbi:carboxymuconolactone decarboxylase family protein [Mesobacillus harenae]|uniref:carboxymuconolactone decarboxylase family protein n=1 Tax=Mesobacillus harenae TaxID=2213203 RepID=UPI0015801A8A|nr:carboxymuconolactone decarboxylase family protein [Mesobacillus harenae]